MNKRTEALQSEQQQTRQLNVARSAAPEPIAIVGMGCRFPGANNTDEYWQLLVQGVDAISEVPENRWDTAAIYHPEPKTPGKTISKYGGFVDNIDQFDPYFFGISPREAVYMDPQQRLLLEVAWEAVEDAGVPAEHLLGSRTGVFLGMCTQDYGTLQRREDAARTVGLHAASGTGRFTAGRIAQVLGLLGPNLVVDTACSSSLVATHLACEALRTGQCDQAFAGGVNVILLPDFHILFSQGGMLAKDGRCKSFSANADGFVRGEGAGLVLLKPLSKALQANDRVYALIRGSAVSSDAHQSHFLTPSIDGQKMALEDAYRFAGVSPGEVQYVEAHGTGTTIGDSIEAQSLGSVLSAGCSKDSPCLIGSCKTNIGHGEAAAGVAGLIKTALSLKHRVIPASLHFEEPNPEIPWDDLPLVVQTRRTPWPTKGAATLAGVNSFGLSGTNAHIVMEEAPLPSSDDSKRNPPSGTTHILPLSARSEASLRSAAAALKQHLRDSEHTDLADICYTAGVRRSHHDHRLAVVGDSREQLIDGLDVYLQEDPVRDAASAAGTSGGTENPVFVFSGVGSQWISMGRRLRQEEPVFREQFERCNELIRQLEGWSLIEEIDADRPASRLQRIDIMQPAIFSMQIALAALWKSWGVEPAAVVGHSLGEYAAVYVAGVLTLEEAIEAVCTRGRLMHRLTGQGGMLAAELNVDQAREMIAGMSGRMSLAAWNSPVSTVFSGGLREISEIASGLEASGVFCRQLKVDVACHSFQMEQIAPDLLDALSSLKPCPEKISIYSTVTGKRISGTEFDAHHWVRNLQSCVMFAPLIDDMLAAGHSAFLEVSPHAVLLAPIRQTAQAKNCQVRALASLNRDQGGISVSLRSLGDLYAAGFPVDWTRLFPSGGQVVSLPAYQWQRQRYWVDVKRKEVHPFLANHWTSADRPGVHYWNTEFDTISYPYLRHHLFQRIPLFPAAVYLEMALAASYELSPPGPRVVRNFEALNAIFMPDDTPISVQLVMTPVRPGISKFEFYTLGKDGRETDGSWVLGAKGTVQYEDIEFEESRVEGFSVHDLESKYSERLDGADFYNHRRTHGPPFQGIEYALYNKGKDHVLASLRAPEELAATAAPYRMHPAIIDMILHCDAARRVCHRPHKFRPEVLAEIKELQVRELLDPHSRYWVISDHVRRSKNAEEGDVTVVDEYGRIIVREKGHVTKSFERSSGITGKTDVDRSTYQVVWESKARPPAIREPSGDWLIFADQSGLGGDLRSQLEQAGSRCTVVTTQQLDSAWNGNIDAVIQGFLQSSEPRGLIHFWSLDVPEDGSEAVLASAQKRVCGSALQIVQALSRREESAKPRLWFVTRGAQPIGGEQEAVHVFQAPLLGLTRVIGNEYPNLRATEIDLAATPAPEDASSLFEELLVEDAEREIALRGAERYVSRLSRYEDFASTLPKTRLWRASENQDRSYEVVSKEQGVLDNLYLRETRRRPPGPGEVEIRVSVASLNFLDVLTALGMAPGSPEGPPFFGIECIGRVVRVGEGVEGVRVGDEVLARDEDDTGCLRAFLTTKASYAVRKPDQLTTEEVATIPVAYTTAYYSLHHLARLRKGESVLIHSAAGGVGLAALQIAQSIGATVFATAGTAEKRDYLKSRGVEHIMDSRSLDFAGEIMAFTEGRGVDVVLNSLAGEAIPKSLSTLATGGRFVEIGKMDIHSGAKLDLSPFKKNLSFFAVDLQRIDKDRPEMIGELWREVSELISDGVVKPLPYKAFQAAEVSDAFHYMAQGKHIGKILVRFDDRDVEVEEYNPPAAGIRDDATYLITGGFGGLGLTVAEWLVEKGARHLALVGRRGPTSETEPIIQSLQEHGAVVEQFAADVSRPDEVTSLLEQIGGSMPPLRGVFHCAGTLDDGVLEQLNWQRFETVFAPKIQGSWNLHSQLMDVPLEHFVLFSSAASVFGAAGQGNYAAANAFLDSLAHYRRTLDLPALVVNWGPWAEVGMAAEPNRGDRMSDQGIDSFSPSAGVDVLEKLVSRNPVQAVAMAIDWNQWFRNFDEARRKPLLARLAAELEANSETEPGHKLTVIDSILDAENADEARQSLLSYLRQEVRKVLRISDDRLDSGVGLNRLGLDSLMAVELRNRIEFDLSLPIPVVQLLRGPSLIELAELLYSEIEKTAVTVAGLSDEEVDDILVRES